MAIEGPDRARPAAGRTCQPRELRACCARRCLRTPPPLPHRVHADTVDRCGNGTVVGSAESYALAMEELASIEPLESNNLGSAVARLRRTGISGGVLILVTGPPDESDLAAFRALGRDFYRTVVMSVAQPGTEAILQFARGGAVTVRSEPDSHWAPAWKEAIERSWSTATAG